MSIAFAEFEPATQNARYVPHTSQTQSTLLHCLVLAEDATRREFFQQQALEADWQVTACADVSSASHAASRFRHSLVIVDLEGTSPRSASNVRALAERLSTDPQQLLIVCGPDGNPLEEIWSRQLGVWLYLSGVDAACDITSLCHQAKQVAEKLSPPQTPAYARTE